MKWLVQNSIALTISAFILFLLHKIEGSNTVLFYATIFLGFIFVVFNLVALRNRYLSPYGTAALQVREIMRGHLNATLEPAGFSEADDLFKSLNDLTSHLKDNSKKIERLERMRIDFIANVSHELKTPLTSIKGYTETLKSGAAHDPEVGARFLDRIEQNANTLTAIISDLLMLSQIESTPQSVVWNTFGTSDMARKLDSTFMPVLQKRAQKLEITFEDFKMEGDAKKWEHVIMNLVDNASRYSGDGTTIRVHQSKDALHWILDIKDNGQGIPKEHQSRIFERFYRVEPDRSRETGGTGLGLAIVKHIVMLHDGTISLESDAGKGTHFHIEWPRKTL